MRWDLASGIQLILCGYLVSGCDVGVRLASADLAAAMYNAKTTIATTLKYEHTISRLRVEQLVLQTIKPAEAGGVAEGSLSFSLPLSLFVSPCFSVFFLYFIKGKR